MSFYALKTRVDRVHNRREEDIEQEGREHARVTKALFHSEPPGAQPVIEPHACSHAIVELTNDRDNILWHAITGEYCPEESWVNGAVRFGKANKTFKTGLFFSAPSPVADES